MKWEIKKFNSISTDELYKIMQIRSDIFVVEQNCPFLDLDGLDEKATHIFLQDDNEILAYCRILEKGVSYDEVSIGRVLVSKKHRSNGYAKLLMQKAVGYIFDIKNEEKITISAQKYLNEFYKSIGFINVSQVYLEDEIEHIKMQLTKK